MPTFGRHPLSSVACTCAVSLALALAGCTGQINRDDPGGSSSGENGGNGSGKGSGSGSGNGSGNGSGSGSGSGSGAGPGQAGEPGQAVFRRLSRTEYNNTIRDLLGDDSRPADAFPPDKDSAKSGFFSGGAVANADASHLLEATEKLATTAMGKLGELLPCKTVPGAAADQDQCAMAFVEQFGKRAFRRPLTQAETSSFVDFYAAQRTAGEDFGNAIRMVLSAMLLSPQFLYRWEVTPEAAERDGQFVRYNGYEMASRLSYLFWASMPDETGFGLAADGKLSNLDQIEAEARRMLKDPKAKSAISDFFIQWLEIADLHSSPKDPKVYPDYSPQLADSMAAETAAFAAELVLAGDGKLSSVFSSNRSFIDANLAKLYGVAGVTGTTLAPTELDPTQRGGILTHGSFLSRHANSEESNPVRRGKLLADRVVCIETPLPPDDVPDPKAPDPNLSVRERFEEHSKNPCATACHQVLDPLGFAFENYNGIGAWQTMDGGKPVDASGVIELDGQKKPFNNAIELGKILGESKQVADCMTRQFLRYTLRRREGKGDEPSVTAALEAFQKESFDLRELLVALTKTRTFTHRTPSMGEVLP